MYILYPISSFLYRYILIINNHAITPTKNIINILLFLQLFVKIGVFELDMLVEGSLSSVALAAPVCLTPELSFDLVSCSSGSFLSLRRFTSDIVSELLCLFLIIKNRDT